MNRKLFTTFFALSLSVSTLFACSSDSDDDAAASTGAGGSSSAGAGGSSAAGSGGSSTAGSSTTGGAAGQAATKDIVDTAVAAGSFTTLAAALQAADLVSTLKGPGPFTVFAPTDDAFKKLPAGTVDTLLKPENKAMLTAILTYHVVPGKVEAKDVVGLTSAKTVNGKEISIKVVDGKVVLDGTSTVTSTDVQATNGVIHVIDTVLIPPS